MSYQVGEFEILLDQREIRRNGTPVRIRPMAFDLLVYLIEHQDRVLTKQELLENIWKAAVTPNSLMQCVGELRRVLDDDPRDPKLIKTVSKTGYRFVGVVEHLAQPPGNSEPPQVSVGTPVPSPSRRLPLWIGVAAAAVVVLLVGLSWGRPIHGNAPVALKTNNMDAYRYYSLGVQQAQHLRTKQALDLFENAIALDPEFAMAHARIGYTYSIGRGDVDRGKPYLERAFRLMGGLQERDCLYVAAWYAQANRDYETAIRVYRDLLARYPDEIEAYHQLGGLFIGEQQSEDAEKTLQDAVKADPSSAQTFNLQSTLYVEGYRFDDAVRAAQHAVALASREPNYHDSLGLAYEARGDFEDAEKSYRTAIAIDPGFDAPVIHLGNLCVRTGRYREAIGYFENYVRNASSPGQRNRAYDYIALVHRMRGDVAQAREVARNVPAGDASIRLALDQHDLTLADQLLSRRALSNERGRRITQRFLLALYGERALAGGKTNEAYDYFRQTLEARVPVWSLDWYEDCLANAYARSGHNREAIAEYREVLDRFPKLAMDWYRLGELYERNGMTTEAKHAMRTFLDLWRNADRDIPERIAAQRML